MRHHAVTDAAHCPHRLSGALPTVPAERQTPETETADGDA